MNEVERAIQNYKDEGYAKFSSCIVNKKNDIYLRVPTAKKIAKNYSNTKMGEQFLSRLPHNGTDENNVHGLMLGYLKNADECIEKLEQFIPLIDNWATCDITCANLKIVKKYPKKFENLVKKWIKSEKPFTKRFAIVILLDYFLNDYFDIEHLSLVNFYCEEYYVQMAQSWYFATALAKKYDETVKLFENKVICNKFVHNKSIQKAVESFRVTEPHKQYLLTLKL